MFFVNGNICGLCVDQGNHRPDRKITQNYRSADLLRGPCSPLQISAHYKRICQPENFENRAGVMILSLVFRLFVGIILYLYH